MNLSVELHGSGIVDPEELVNTCHLGNVIRFPFLLLFKHKKVNWIVLGFRQFESLHNLKTSFSQSRIPAFRYVAILALELSGLIRRRIITCIGIFAGRKC